MKNLKNSFLFFCFILSFLNTDHTQAQKVTDSLSYYYNFLLNAKESSDLISTYRFYNKHKELSLAKKDTISAIQDLRFIFYIQHELGQHYESEATAVEALQLANDLKATEVILEARVGIYNHLGILAKESKNYHRAIEYYNKVLEIEKSPSNITTIRNNKANVYRVQKKYEIALQEFLEVYKNAVQLGDTVQISRALDNMGLVKSKLENPNALQDMLLALEMRLKGKSNSDLYVSYIHLAEYYFDRSITSQIKHYAQKAYDMAVKLNNGSDKVRALALILATEDNSRINEYKKLTDSIAEAKQLNENKFISIKYDYAQEKRKAESAKINFIESKLLNEKEHRSKIIAQLTILFVCIVGIVFTLLLRSRHKKDKIIQVYNTETRISKKVHDEVANDIYQIMTKFQENDSNQEEVLDVIESVYFKTRDISKENSIIHVHENFDGLLEDLILSYDFDKVNVIINDLKTVDWKKISDEKKITIYRVLQELMTNMRKHSKASYVVVSFLQKSKRTFINYSDNGKGGELIKGSGLHNMESRIQSIHGRVTFESIKDKGFKAKLVI